MKSEYLKTEFARLEEKYRDVPEDFKNAIIQKAWNRGLRVAANEHVGFTYEYSLHSLLRKTFRSILNTSKSLGYKEPPCPECKRIINAWPESRDKIFCGTSGFKM